MLNTFNVLGHILLLDLNAASTVMVSTITTIDIIIKTIFGWSLAIMGTIL